MKHLMALTLKLSTTLALLTLLLSCKAKVGATLGDTRPWTLPVSVVVPAEKYLRKHYSVQRFQSTLGDCLRVDIGGQLALPVSPNGTLEAVYQFLDENRVVFGLSDPREEIGFRPRNEWPPPVDSLDWGFRGQKGVNYTLSQYHDGIPVVNSRIEIHMWRDPPVISSLWATLVPGLTASRVPNISDSQAVVPLLPELTRIDRCCNVDKSRLYMTRIQGRDHLFWRLDIGCRPRGAHWGEETWVDAHSGYILKTFHTWIE